MNRSAATPQRLDSPGVRIPPPLVYALAFLIGWALQARFPLPFLSSPLALGLGGALMVAGGLFIVSSILTLLHGRGTLNTNGASAALVASGPYRISRNPMYLGLVLLYGGLVFVVSVVWALLLLIPLIV
jgi:protein-S-isoprenylcysteine O-methyltransferase Ste14